MIFATPKLSYDSESWTASLTTEGRNLFHEKNCDIRVHSLDRTIYDKITRITNSTNNRISILQNNTLTAGVLTGCQKRSWNTNQTKNDVWKDLWNDGRIRFAISVTGLSRPNTGQDGWQELQYLPTKLISIWKITQSCPCTYHNLTRNWRCNFILNLGTRWGEWSGCFTPMESTTGTYWIWN